MKDTILNSALIACVFSAFLVAVIDDARSGPQTAVAQVNSVVKTQTTVVAMGQMPSNAAQVPTVEQ
jgi:hypothetical protein